MDLMKVCPLILSLWVAALAVACYYVFVEDIIPQSHPDVSPPSEHAAPVHWQAAAPLIAVSGPFHNQQVNLYEVGLQEWLGGAFSLMVTFEMDDLNYWSRLFDFSIGVDQESISAGSMKHGYDLHFTITKGPANESRGVHVPDFFLLGKPTTVLFTVSSGGHMKVWHDGELFAENPKGHAPGYLERPHLLMGGHHALKDQKFRGKFYDIKVWSQEVTWDQDLAPGDGMRAVAPGERPDEPGPARPWQSVEPLLELAGPFNEENPADLGTSGLDEPLGGALSLMVTAVLDEVVPWSRVFDFAVGPDIEMIGAGMVEEGRGVHFTINQGHRKASVFVDDFFRFGAEITALFTVSGTGHMKLYLDGELVGENKSGPVPNYLKRPYMNIGNHHCHRDQGFRGLLKDIKLWNSEVTWELEDFIPDQEPLEEEAEAPEEGGERQGRPAAPWQEVSPVFEIQGPFNGSNVGDLARSGLYHWFSGSFGIMVTIRMDDTNKWSRVFDFSVGADLDAISVGSVKDSLNMFFAIYQGKEQTLVTIPDFFILEHEITALFTVSDRGHMKVYVNGELHGQNENGMVPAHLKRPHLTVGSHYRYKEQGFRGSLRDIKIWNREVYWLPER